MLPIFTSLWHSTPVPTANHSTSHSRQEITTWESFTALIRITVMNCSINKLPESKNYSPVFTFMYQVRNYYAAYYKIKKRTKLSFTWWHELHKNTSSISKRWHIQTTAQVCNLPKKRDVPRMQ